MSKVIELPASTIHELIDREVLDRLSEDPLEVWRDGGRFEGFNIWESLGWPDLGAGWALFGTSRDACLALTGHLSRVATISPPSEPYALTFAEAATTAKALGYGLVLYDKDLKLRRAYPLEEL